MLDHNSSEEIAPSLLVSSFLISPELNACPVKGLNLTLSVIVIALSLLISLSAIFFISLGFLYINFFTFLKNLDIIEF